MLRPSADLLSRDGTFVKKRLAMDQIYPSHKSRNAESPIPRPRWTVPVCDGVGKPLRRRLRKSSVTCFRIGALLSAISAWALFAATARAAPRPFVVLEYEVEPDVNGCPGTEEFRSMVERQLGYDPFRPVADQRVAVQIARRGNGLEGRIRWSDDRGRWVGDRRLASRSQICDEITATLAFSVSVQIQLIAMLASSTPEPPPQQQAPVVAPAAAQASEPALTSPPQPNREAAPATPPAPKPASESPPHPDERARRLKLSLGLGPSLALGVAPRPTGLGRIFVSGRVSWFSFEIALDGALPVTQREVDGSAFSLDRFAAGAAACGHVRAFAACVIATAGLLQARGLDVDAPASPAGPFSQLGARLAAARDLGPRYFVAARVDGLVMLSHWTVTLNETAVWTTPRVGVLVGLDVGVRLF